VRAALGIGLYVVDLQAVSFLALVFGEWILVLAAGLIAAPDLFSCGVWNVTGAGCVASIACVGRYLIIPLRQFRTLKHSVLWLFSLEFFKFLFCESHE
jgi:hypothetical protein